MGPDQSMGPGGLATPEAGGRVPACGRPPNKPAEAPPGESVPQGCRWRVVSERVVAGGLSVEVMRRSESPRGAACAPGWGTARRSREGVGPSSAEHPVADRMGGTRRARSHR
eukprot:scaffold143729_cov75-Phaeocystis_antarctica.AAC.1